MVQLTLVKSGATQRATGGSNDFAASLRSEGCSPRTISAYLSDLNKYGVTSETPYERHVRVASAVLDEGSAPSTRRRRLSALSKFFSYAFPGRADNPYRLVRRPVKGVVLPDVVPTPQESRTLIEGLLASGTKTDLRTAAAIALMAGAGLRLAEVLGLRFCDVHPAAKNLRVVDGKGSKTRDVPLNDFTLDVLSRYVTNSHTAPPRPFEFLFTVTGRTIQRDVAALSEAADNGRNLHPHAFRHGFATAVYRNTTDLRLTADLLGHSSVTTTAIYTHVADDRRVEAVDVTL